MKVLVFSDYYLTGYRGGGVITGVASMVENLYHEHDFNLVITLPQCGRLGGC